MTSIRRPLLPRPHLRRGRAATGSIVNQLRVNSAARNEAATLSRWRLPHPALAGFVVAAVLWCVAIAMGLLPEAAGDARGWWLYHLPDPYVITDYSKGVGLYFAPPLAFAFYPLTFLPWALFAAVWTGVTLAALGILAGRWAALALLIPFVWWEVSAANVALLVGLAVVVGFRYPATWAFILLTKVTPGVGLLWFAVRREWRNLGIALGATVAISAISFVVAPHLWFEWVALLTSNAGNNGPGYFVVPVSLPIRLLAAALIVTWGALTDRRWTLVVAVTLGYPVLWWNALATLIAMMALRRSTAPA